MPEKKPAPRRDRQFEKVECEYVYLDEQGQPIDLPLGTYRPEDYEEQVIEVAEGDEETLAKVLSPRGPEPEAAPSPIPAAPPQPAREPAPSPAPDLKARPAAGPSGPPAAPAEAPLVLRQAWRGYQSGGGRVEVLKDVSLSLAAGELVIVAGPSGSGKSTLLSVMGCLLRPDRGQVRVMGRDVSALPETELQEVRRRHMGFIFQNIYLMAALSAHENVRVALDIKLAGGRPPRSALELLSMVSMAEYARRLPRELSGGQCQRVAVARALAAGPRIILADEPTAALDTDNALSVMRLLKDLTTSEGLATAVVTHDVRLFQFADRVLSLDAGRLREVRRNEK
ncbi:MAG TPA: ABC transporter ATP-binding protein [Planctomycetota bacterium]|nr:ABC transporter ATP-binding protein [Planctomycetota bacterium]